MRYERKYRIDGQFYETVLHEMMSNPAVFRFKFPDRTVNSIYYDNVEFKALKENLQGIRNRVKYRIRWYGEDLSNLKRPVLEKKIKINMLGRKEYEPLDDFNLMKDLERISEEPTLKKNELQAVTLVRYERTYLQSFDDKIRATIDRNIQYYKIQSDHFVNVPTMDHALILELKHEECDTELADYCLQSIPYRLTKNSKYVSAIMSQWS